MGQMHIQHTNTTHTQERALAFCLGGGRQPEREELSQEESSMNIEMFFFFVCNLLLIVCGVITTSVWCSFSVGQKDSSFIHLSGHAWFAKVESPPGSD